MRRCLLLLFLLVFICRGAERRDAPPGFDAQRFGPWGGELFVPDNWEYHEPGGPSGGTYMIAKAFAPDGTYDTGMRIQFIPGVKKANGLTPKEAVAVNVRIRKETEKVIRECPPEEFGLFTRICIETRGYPVKSKPKQEYHLISAFWWSDQLDLIAGVTFGAPVEEWDSVKSVYDISGNIKIYDDAWVRAHAANGAGGEASKSSNAPPPAKGSAAAPATPQQHDTGLDAVVKLGSIQFVNRMEDLQWRLGTRPDALIASIQAMREIIAEELQSAGIKEPAVVNAMLGIPPKGRMRVWLIGREGMLSANQHRELTRKLESVPPPEVRNGPVALNLTLELNGAKAGNIDPQKMRLPDEWREAVQGKPVQLPDGLPESIWTTEPK
jgi:hypothetical protein